MGEKKAKAKGPAMDKSRWSAEAFWKIRQTVQPTWWQHRGLLRMECKQRETNPPWQAGRRRPNRWERLGVAENGLESDQQSMLPNYPSWHALSHENPCRAALRRPLVRQLIQLLAARPRLNKRHDNSAPAILDDGSEQGPGQGYM
ncbi:hypothetical protein J3F84DRAFT_375027 [Trichoderma pleuroticola]